MWGMKNCTAFLQRKEDDHKPTISLNDSLMSSGLLVDP